jgi:DNA-binding NarL/FixJ family response regulator
VAVLGVSHLEHTGFDVLKKVHADPSGVPVLVLCAHPPPTLIKAALDSGASGVVTDSSSLNEVVAAIGAVANGKCYMGAPPFGLPSAPAERLRTESPVLSTRQKQMLCHLAAGRTPTEISELTGLSVRTVSTHKARLRQKLNLSSNAQLISYAIRYYLP